jgi:hypothetical protein
MDTASSPGGQSRNRTTAPGRRRTAQLEHDLAGGSAAVDQLERLVRALQREARSDDRPHEALVDEPVHLRADLAVHVTLAHHERAPARSHHLGVVQEQPVDPHLGDRAAREADHDQPAVLAERAEAVREAVTANRVDHDVDPAARQLLGLVLPGGVRAHHLVGARLARHALLVVGRHDRDRACAEALGDLEGRRPDPAGGAVHEHGLALAQAAAVLQREICGVVVEDQAGALREVELVRQLEGEEVGGDGDLRERPE